jgi:hypothetical protein
MPGWQPPKEPRQLALALLDRLASEIATVKLDEGHQCHSIIAMAVAKQLEVGEAVSVARNHFAVDNAGADRERLDGRGDGPKAFAPIEAATREEPHGVAVASGEHPVAVVFDFVHPIGTGGRGRCARRKADFEGQHGRI